ncbi:hypothetical protein GCM10027416_04630 [Okibacterium endophyticum]
MVNDQVARVRVAMQRQLVHAILDNDRVAREHGLRVIDLQTLHLMVLREDVRTPRQISVAAGMPASSVTKVVDRLETAGYIRRAHDPHDRRRTLLELVPEAVERLTIFYRRTDHSFDELSSQFSAPELDAVTRYLDAVSDFYIRLSSSRT